MLSLLATITTMMAGFAIVPNISSYVQGNRGYPREQLGALYLAGGSVSFLAMRLMGSYVDKLGAARVSALAPIGFIAVLAAGFVYELPIPVMSIYVGFMTAMAFRNISMTTL